MSKEERWFYEEGDHCDFCGLPVKKDPCNTCKGSGKHWNSSCPLCNGSGYNYRCPVLPLLSFGEYLKGLSCEDFLLTKDGKLVRRE